MYVCKERTIPSIDLVLKCGNCLYNDKSPGLC